MRELVAPQKCYLDTNHLVNISRLRAGSGLGTAECYADAYRFLDKAIREGLVAVVFCDAAPLDWIDGNASIDSAKRLAAVIDSALVRYDVESDTHVFLWEVLEEARRLEPGIRLPTEWPILRRYQPGEVSPRGLDVLSTEVPGYFADVRGPVEAIGFMSAAETVESAVDFKRRSRAIYDERVQGYYAAYARDRSSYLRALEQGTLRQAKNRWVRDYLRADFVLRHMNPSADVDSVIRRLRFSRCPAVALFFAARDWLVRRGKDPDPNDVDDHMFLQVVPYVDLVLTDRAFANEIRAASKQYADTVYWKPSDAVAQVKRWLGLTQA